MEKGYANTTEAGGWNVELAPERAPERVERTGETQAERPEVQLGQHEARSEQRVAQPFEQPEQGAGQELAQPTMPPGVESVAIDESEMILGAQGSSEGNKYDGDKELMQSAENLMQEPIKKVKEGDPREAGKAFRLAQREFLEKAFGRRIGDRN